MEGLPPNNHNSLTARLLFSIRKKPPAKDNAEIITQREQAISKDKTLQNRLQKKRKPSEQDAWAIDPSLGERRAIGSLDSIFSEAPTLVNRERGSVVDTDYLHGLAEDSFDSNSKGVNSSWYSKDMDPNDARLRSIDPRIIAANETRIAALSPELWLYITSFLNAADAASLACSTKTLRDRLGPEPWDALQRSENAQYKVAFLLHLDRSLPDHLLCFPCGTYHRRIQKGEERLQADYVTNPLFICPKVKTTVLPRARLTHGRELPFAFSQLALRAHRHSPEHGVPWQKLDRRWKCNDSGWSHTTRFHIVKGHLFFRCVSMCHAPPNLTLSQQRLFLYSRTNYMPYFSVCAHWQDGELMNLCKCALGHIPKPPDPILNQLGRRPKVSLSAARPNFIVNLCEECRPMRRCPQCPTEYVIEVRMVEDKSDRQNTFKHALVVTRWSDLGDGTSPSSPEWAACTGQGNYKSFDTIGKRAIAGIFESECSNTVPTQRVLSLNPRKQSLGEEGHDWY